MMFDNLKPPTFSAATQNWPSGHVRRLVRRLSWRLASLPGTTAARLSTNPLFDGAWYAERYPDVAVTGMHPLQHYLCWGAKEGRDPHPLFDTSYYIGQAGEAASRNPLLHYLNAPPGSALSPHPLFNARWYLDAYPDVAAARINPLVHFLTRGASEGRDPGPHFRTRDYCRMHPALEAEGPNPLIHYVVNGGALPTPADRTQNIPVTSAWPMPRNKDTIRIIDAAAPGDFSLSDPDGVVIVMPSIDTVKAKATAELLLRRASLPATVLIAEDTTRQGFIATLNLIAARIEVKYLVYTAEDAFPGLDWLKIAHDRLEESGKGLLAFNCGKWRGRIAAFGMVRTAWVKRLYGGPIFHPGYKAHKADNELTVIARVTGEAIYEPDAVLVEVDPGKVFVENVPTDRTLFRKRFRTGFDGLAPVSLLEPLAEAYFVDMNPPEPVKIYRAGASSQEGALALGTSEQGSPAARLRERLIADAEAALKRGPYSVIDKITLPPSGNLQDYWHPAPYWWPDPDSPDGLPFIRRDGKRVPGTRLYEPDSEKYDRTRLQRVFDDTYVLALALQATGDERYSAHGASILHRFFLDPKTRVNPHLRFGQVRMGHDANLGAPSGLIEMKDLYFYLDAVEILESQGALMGDALDAFKEWLNTYMDWLLKSPQGQAEREAVNNHGTCFDLQLGSIADFLGDSNILDETLMRARMRIGQQFDEHGRQPEELGRTSTAHYCCFNLQSWINLADLAKRVGVDLWTHEASNGASLHQAARWLLSHMGGPWPYAQLDAFDADRFLPIWFAARAAGVSGLPEMPAGISGPFDVKPLFFPHDGIRPYWNLVYRAE